MNVTRWLMGRIWLLSGTQIRSFTRSSWWITHAAQSVCCVNGKCITWKCVNQEGNMMRYKQSTLSRNCHFCRIVLFWDSNQVVTTKTMTTLMNVIQILNASEYSSDFRNKTQMFSWYSLFYMVHIGFLYV